MATHHDHELPTLPVADLEHVTGGAGNDAMSSMMPMMIMMMMKGKGGGGSASAAAPPPAPPAAPLVPRVIVNGVEQTPQSADGTSSYQTTV
jgi:hypothetical protein